MKTKSPWSAAAGIDWMQAGAKRRIGKPVHSALREHSDHGDGSVKVIDGKAHRYALEVGTGEHHMDLGKEDGVDRNRLTRAIKFSNILMIILTFSSIKGERIIRIDSSVKPEWLKALFSGSDEELKKLAESVV